jgi:hypothetical protein
MDDNSSDSDQNIPSFPLFNFDALKHSFPTAAIEQPIQIEKDVLSKASDEGSSKTNRSSKPRKSKNSKTSEDEKITMKDILEDIQSGIPMEADLKMKEDRLRKMREGKQRKKLLKDQQVEKALENARNMTSITEIPQTLLNFNTPSTANNPVVALTSGQIVIKDGKPVFEFPESTRHPPLLVESRKPSKLSSLSFRKNNYTKHWTQEETRKFYKGIEIFGSDFSMISKLFENRDRMQIKNKLRKEEKKHSKKVEDAFKKHESSKRKHIMSHISDLTRKSIKQDPSSDLQIENLPIFSSENNRNRSFSNCSIDSMDAKIIDDLKGIITQELLANPHQKFLPQNESILDSEMSKPDRVKVNERKVVDDSLKENKPETINIDHKETINFKDPEPKKNNLLLNLLNK